MSSTNRSSVRDNHEEDYYVTPHGPIREFLDALFKAEQDYQWDKVQWADVCAGGRIGAEPMSYPTVLAERGIAADTFDIRTDSPAAHIGDYLKTDCGNRYDVICTNPPFDLAQQVITKALWDVRPGGWVVMLLRLNFFGSQKRRQFWRDNMPTYSFVHSVRMGFRHHLIDKPPAYRRGTDSIEYQHLVWKKGHNPQFCQLTVI